MASVQPQDSVAARVNSDRAGWEMSNPNEFTDGTHDRNLNQATPAAARKLGKSIDLSGLSMSMEQMILGGVFLPSYAGIGAGVLKMAGIEPPEWGILGVIRSVMGAQIWLSIEMSEMD